MSTLVRTIGFAGVGAIGLAALSFASPAIALPTSVAGCGDVPAGATLTKLDIICELDFTATGANSWTVPVGVTGISAMLLGGGGGAHLDAPSANGYAGSGGQIIYVDNQPVTAGETATVSVGTGGATVDRGVATAGGDTTITVASATTTAVGGSGGSVDADYCDLAGSTAVYAANGHTGAGGAGTNSGASCATGYAPGANPGSDWDNSSPSRPPMMAFFGYTLVYGNGGRVVSAPDALSSSVDLVGTGRGADVLYVAPSSVSSADATGGSGRVIIRYLAESTGGSGSGSGSGGGSGSGSGSGTGSGAGSTTNAALASTGIDVFAPVALLSALGIAGVAFLALARRRLAVTSSTKR